MPTKRPRQASPNRWERFIGSPCPQSFTDLQRNFAMLRQDELLESSSARHITLYTTTGLSSALSMALALLFRIAAAATAAARAPILPRNGYLPPPRSPKAMLGKCRYRDPWQCR